MEVKSVQKVYFEVTNRCNFRCDFCPIGESTREKKHMDWDLFTKGIDEIARERITDTVGFHILGEPLLYPAIDDAVRYANAHGLRTEINTNGSLLVPDRVERLIAAGLGQLTVSVQTVGEQAHACRGSDLPYHVYYQRVMEAVRLIKASGSTMDVVLCFMDTSTRRFFDIDKLMRLGQDRDPVGHGLAAFVVDLYAASGRQVTLAAAQASLRRLNLREPRFVHLDEQLDVYVQPLADWGNAFTSRQVRPARVGTCGYALHNVGVLNNGEVTICCADYDGKTSLGNLQHDSLAALLASRQACVIREGFRRNRVIHPYCQRCLGSPNPLKTAIKGLVSIYLFKWRGFQPAKVKRVSLFPA